MVKHWLDCDQEATCWQGRGHKHKNQCSSDQICYYLLAGTCLFSQEARMGNSFPHRKSQTIVVCFLICTVLSSTGRVLGLPSQPLNLTFLHNACCRWTKASLKTDIVKSKTSKSRRGREQILSLYRERWVGIQMLFVPLWYMLGDVGGGKSWFYWSSCHLAPSGISGSNI